MKILYVEDERMTRMLLAKMLTRAKFVVYEAENGLSGLKKYYEHEPDLIVTNLEMPEMNGFKMIRKIREIDPDIPIIVTSAYRDEARKISDMADAFVFKPVIKSDLVATIERLTISCSAKK